MNRAAHHKKLIKDWRDKIEAGDILLSSAGIERTVREVTYCDDGFMRAVVLSILKCSWTQRCHTTISRIDLKYRGFRPSGYRWTNLDLLDKQIEQEIRNHGKPKIKCCDVIGVTR